MMFVNSCGWSDIGKIDEKNPIKFKSRTEALKRLEETTYIALDWSSEGKKSYDEKAANVVATFCRKPRRTFSI